MKLLAKLLAADDLGIGTIKPPVAGGKGYEAGLENFINNGFRIVFLGFGAYAMLNFVMAAYKMINSQGEQKNVDQAKKMVTHSIISLLLLSVVFIFAGIVGQVFFGSWDYLLNPVKRIQEIKP